MNCVKVVLDKAGVDVVSLPGGLSWEEGSPGTEGGATSKVGGVDGNIVASLRFGPASVFALGTEGGTGFLGSEGGRGLCLRLFENS